MELYFKVDVAGPIPVVLPLASNGLFVEMAFFIYDSFLGEPLLIVSGFFFSFLIILSEFF